MQYIESQTPAQREESNVRQIKIIDNDAKPSWKRYGKGTRRVEVGAALDRSWISFNTAEVALADEPGKRDVERETFFTADREAALAIYEMLREIFGDAGDRPVIDLEISARKQPYSLVYVEATPVDRVGVTFKRNHVAGDRFTYTHNGVQIDRDRAVELLCAI